MDLPIDHARKICERNLAALKPLFEDEDLDPGVKAAIAQAYQDIGVLGAGYKFRLDKETEYQSAFKTLNEEVIRLHMTIDTLAEKYTDVMNLADEYEKELETWRIAYGEGRLIFVEESDKLVDDESTEGSSEVLEVRPDA